ncbi:MAG: hypothetical protein M9921_06555 [Fimbriimonadaceae bacterium]|nr:hypothetical protein [Fimbriimonadaceae bacterium]
MRSAHAFALLGLLLLAAGCASSEEDEALARIRNRPAPGFVRILNLTDQSFKVMWTNFTLDEHVGFGTASMFRPIGSGKKQTIALLVDDKPAASFEVEVPTDDRVTLVVYNDGDAIASEAVVGDATKWGPGPNVQVHFVNLDGSAPSGEISLSGAGSFTVDPPTQTLELPAGEYTLAGNGLADAVGGRIEANAMYSVYVVATPDGKKHAFLVRNTSTDRPAASASS